MPWDQMPIPAAESYPMPTNAQLPANRVAWKLDPARCALLVHDMQRYFVNIYAAGSPPLSDLLINAAAIRRRCADLSIPTYFSYQPGSQSVAERGLLQDFWGAGIGGGQEVTAIVEELAPSQRDTMIVKRRYSAFHRTDLLSSLKSAGKDQLIICGVFAHIGCLVTAIEAFMNDIQPFLVADAVADFSAARRHGDGTTICCRPVCTNRDNERDRFDPCRNCSRIQK